MCTTLLLCPGSIVSISNVKKLHSDNNQNKWTYLAYSFLKHLNELASKPIFISTTTVTDYANSKSEAKNFYKTTNRVAKRVGWCQATKLQLRRAPQNFREKNRLHSWFILKKNHPEICCYCIRSSACRILSKVQSATRPCMINIWSTAQY